MNYQLMTDHLIEWGNNHNEVRAILLTGSHANPNKQVDQFSDYDVVLIVQDIYPFHQNKQWIADFGEALVTYWDPLEKLEDYNFQQVRNVIHYRDGLHIDFTVWSVELMQEVISRQILPNDFDDGYIQLLDKDGITQHLPAPTYSIFIPTKPSEATYQKNVEDFFSDVPYVAKCLWRDELLPAKWCLDFDMKHVFLLQMLEWWIAIQTHYAVTTGILGRGMKHHLPTSLWQQLEATYVGADIEDNWQAFFATIELFRKIAVEVGTSLGYNYPHNMDKECVAYAHKVKATPHQSPSN